jgi:peptide/nickel transport system substrate-binding protein
MRKKNIAKKVLLLSMAFCIVSFTLTSLHAQTKEPQYGGTLRIGTNADATANLGYPPDLILGSAIPYVNCCIENLMGLDEKGLPAPLLATDWKVSKDLKSVTLTLRKGVKFHDGTPWNAEAAKWNLDKLQAGRTNVFLKAVKSVDVVDDYTVRLNLSEWENILITNLVTHGMMISPTAYKTHGQEWCMKNPVGTGPFKFVSWERDVKEVYEKFDGYWKKGKPYLDRVEWHIIADPVTRVAAFKRREVDAIINVDKTMARDLETNRSYNISKAINRIVGFFSDSKNPGSLFADLRVRQAIEYALDKKAICDQLGAGYWIPIWQPAIPGGWAENSAVAGYRYNPKKAKELLAEAGYPSGLKTKIYSSSVLPYTDLAVAVQGYLKAIGITTEIELMERSRYYQTVVDSGWKDGLVFSEYSVRTPDDIASISRIHGPGFAIYKNVDVPPEYQNLIVQAVVAPDFESKKALSHKVMKAAVDNCVVSWLFFEQGIAASYSKIHNLELYGAFGPYIWTSAEAWIEK